MSGDVICFIGFFLCFLSGNVIDFVVKSLQANSHSFNPELGGGLVAGKPGHLRVYDQCLSRTCLLG